MLSFLIKLFMIPTISTDIFYEINKFLLPQERLNVGRTCTTIRAVISKCMANRSETLFLDSYSRRVIAHSFKDESGTWQGYFITKNGYTNKQKFLAISTLKPPANYTTAYNRIIFGDELFYLDDLFSMNFQKIHKADHRNIRDVVDDKLKNASQQIYTRVYLDRQQNIFAIGESWEDIYYFEGMTYARTDGETLELKFGEHEYTFRFKHRDHHLNAYFGDQAEYYIDRQTGDMVTFDDNSIIHVIYRCNELEYIFGEDVVTKNYDEFYDEL